MIPPVDTIRTRRGGVAFLVGLYYHGLACGVEAGVTRDRDRAAVERRSVCIVPPFGDGRAEVLALLARSNTAVCWYCFRWLMD